jgi:hypothetical protein
MSTATNLPTKRPAPATNKTSHDRFMATMTFAFPGASSCDCDECEGGECFMPKEVGDAVEQHKRLKMFNDLCSTITQERSLVTRYDGLSVWKLTMPPGAPPFTEYGNTHRFIFVEHKPKNRIVKSIGKGIIGSSSEEGSRLEESGWEEKNAFLYRSNGGKAIGWVNDKLPDDKDLNISDTSNDVVVYVVKATRDMLESFKTMKGNTNESDSALESATDIDTMPTWVSGILKILQKSLLDTAVTDKDEKKDDEIESKKCNKGERTSKEDAQLIRQMIDPFIRNEES